MNAQAANNAFGRWRAAVGVFATLFFGWQLSPNILAGEWASLLLLLAALVLVPIAAELAQDSTDPAWLAPLWRAFRWLAFPAALLLGFAVLRPSGTGALLLALPWSALLGLLAVVGGSRLYLRRQPALHWRCRDTGLLFAGVGAAWTVADRAGLRPLEFEPAIVQLTSIHFHYAGVVLPVATALAVREFPRAFAGGVAAGGVIVGVPLVALGITSTQLGWSHAIEVVAVAVMASSGMLVAGLHLALVSQSHWPVLSRVAWAVASGSLVLGMSLAALYGMRNHFPLLPWLDIPWMRALHGTVNTLGFSGFALLGWTRVGAMQQSKRDREDGL